MELPKCHYLLIGATGSGKTRFAFTLAKKWVNGCKALKTVYIVNYGSHPGDVPRGCKVLSWNKLMDSATINTDSDTKPKKTKAKADVSNAVVLIEDIIKISTEYKDCLKTILNYYGRRSNVWLLLITHSLADTRLMGITQYIENLIFFGSGLNLSKSFKILKDTDGLDDRIKSEGSAVLRKHCRKFKPVLLNLLEQEMSLVTDDGRVGKILIESPDKRQEEEEEEQGESSAAADDDEEAAVNSGIMLRGFIDGFDKYFSGAQLESERKLGYFLAQNVPDLLIRHGNVPDMTLTLRSRGKGDVRVSLLDFILACTDSKSKRASWKIRSLYRFLAQKMEMPSFLVKNRNIKRLEKGL